MRLKTSASLIMFVLAAVSASAQNLLIDDFTSGFFHPSKPYYSGTTNGSVQTGNMMGFSRNTNMYVCAPQNCSAQNPYNQPNYYGFYDKTETQPAEMVQTAGYFASPRIDMGYGFGTHMDKFFAGYQKIRVSFQSLSRPLNFNIQLFTGTAWAQGGCNIDDYAAPFAVELPLNDFEVTPNFDLAHVNLANFIFQSSSAIGAVDFGITRIELANDTYSGTGPVISCHY